MEREMVRYSYWLGVALMVAALVWRVVNAFGLKSSVMTVSYMTLYKGAVILFLTAIATTGYAWVKSQKP
jgi:hypothetical protein